MDRLPAQEKDLLQTLAVIGKEFPLGLIKGVVERSEDDLYRGLSRLQAAEFIYEQPAFPDPEYTFKHSLTQDVAYQSLLGERRSVLHERTGQAIEELYCDALDAHYGELAYHYSRTENTPKAIGYLHLAGEQALQRLAYTEAISQLRKGVDLQLTLGQALVTQGPAAPETEQAYTRARDLCEEVGEAPQLFRALQGLHNIHVVRAELDRAGELGKQLLCVARATRNSEHLLLAHFAMGTTCHWRGEFRQAREHLEEAIGCYEPQECRIPESLWVSEDPGVQILGYLSQTLWNLGYPDEALRRSREALALARELAHPVSQAAALVGLSRAHGHRGEYRAGLEAAEAVLTLGSEHGLPYWVGAATFMRAAMWVDLGHLQKGIAGMRDIVEALRAMGTVLASPSIFAVLAKAYGRAKEAEKGIPIVADALEFVTRTGEREAEAEVHRVKGELLLAQSAPSQADAEASFRKGLDVARRQGTKSYELRAATSLARLWQQQGRKDEARELLAPVYDWFTEGFDTRDLKEAKALLDELA
jgi:predicted ATPase